MEHIRESARTVTVYDYLVVGIMAATAVALVLVAILERHD